MKWEMAKVRWVAGNETGNGNGGKSNGNSDKVGRQATASRAMARATVTRGQW
jgi:hypothetical protein